MDVEEKARAKDLRGKKIVEANSSAHVVHKGRQNSHKKKFKQSSNKRTLLLLRRRRRINRTKERASAILVVLRDTMPQNARRACIGPRNLQT